MDYLLNILAGISAYVIMEFIAAITHKYLMHGILKKWHYSHHINDLNRPDEMVKNNGVEKNDRFFLIFAIPAMVIMMLGITISNWILISISIGITLYGLTYFIIHDILYHKRISAPLIQRISSNYLRAILRAHNAHHKPKNKKDFESYGLLIFPKKHLNND